MNGRWRRTVPWVVVLLVLLSFPAIGDEKPNQLAVDTALHSGAGEGDLYGLLREKTPLTELETDGEWVKVIIEGWVHVSAVKGHEPGSSSAPAPPPAPPATKPANVPPPTASSASASPNTPPSSVAPATVPPASFSTSLPIEGRIRVKVGRSKRKNGVGAQVWLLPATFQPDGVGEAGAAEDAERLAVLDAEASRLKKEADRALQKITNFTEATEAHDDLMSQRRKVLSERQDILAVQHGRHQAAARQAALDSAVTDSKGYFNFPAVSPGEYMIYARMVDKLLDLQWLETIDVNSGRVEIDLDESTAQGLSR